MQMLRNFKSKKLWKVIVKVKGKNKRSRYRIKKRPDWKKAYVRLTAGQSIEVGTE